MPLTIGLSILVSGAFGTVQAAELPTPVPVVAKVSVASVNRSERAAMASAVMSSPADPDVLDAVQEYFSDIPIMVAIASCESGYHQDDLNGNTLRSVTNDLGVMQINSYAHSATAAALGYDLTKLYGNMAYARYLYNQSGTSPWLSSSRCWGPKSATIARANTAITAQTE
jgi:hypothetical protein